MTRQQLRSRTASRWPSRVSTQPFTLPDRDRVASPRSRSLRPARLS
jgi:hypothetical protein